MDFHRPGQEKTVGIDKSISLQSPPGIGAYNIQNAVFLREEQYEPAGGPQGGINFNNNGTQLFMSNSEGDRISEIILPDAFDITDGLIADVLDTSGDISVPTNIQFSPNGEILNVIEGFTDDEVGVYRFSTGFDLTTEVSFALQPIPDLLADEDIFGIAFNSDGTEVSFVLEPSYNVYTGELLTPYDVSTIQSPPISDTSTGGILVGEPKELTFARDGDTLFILDDAFPQFLIHEFSLSTPYDATTLSFVRSVNFPMPNFIDLSFTFNPDGTKLYGMQPDGWVTEWEGLGD